MKDLKTTLLKAVVMTSSLALFHAAFSQELETAASAQETPSVEPSVTPPIEEALPVVGEQVQEVMAAVVSGSVQETVDLSSELIPTENATAENIDESFLHFQGINDLLSIPIAPILAVAQNSTPTLAIIGEGVTQNGEPCLIEREQPSSSSSENNPYTKNVLVRMTILSRSGPTTHVSVALNEDDVDFRINHYSRETDPHKIDRETLNIEANRVSSVLGAEPKLVRAEISATLELQKLRVLRISGEWQNENSTLQIKSDATCLNIQSDSKASKVFTKAL